MTTDKSPLQRNSDPTDDYNTPCGKEKGQNREKPPGQKTKKDIRTDVLLARYDQPILLSFRVMALLR